MNYKNLKSYKNFLNSKDEMFLESNTENTENEEEKKIKEDREKLQKSFVQDPKNPLDVNINKTLENIIKKTDIFVKDDDGKMVYTAQMYRQLKLVDLDEFIMGMKNKYFIEGERPEGEEGEENIDASGSTNENHTLNENLFKKLFNYALKKAKMYAKKVEASKNLDPIFKEAEEKITGLFNDKTLVDGFRKVNSDKEKLKKELETELKETKKLLEETSKELETAIQNKSKEETGEHAFKKGDIFTYEQEDKTKVRIIVVEETPLEVIRISTDEHGESITEEKPLSNLTTKAFKPTEDNILAIGDGKKDDVYTEYEEVIDEVTDKEGNKVKIEKDK